MQNISSEAFPWTPYVLTPGIWGNKQWLSTLATSSGTSSECVGQHWRGRLSAWDESEKRGKKPQWEYTGKPSPWRKWNVSCSVMSNSLQPHGLQPARLLCPWNAPGKNTRVGCHALIQGIFLTQGSNLDLPHCRQILYHLSHQGSPPLKEGRAK